MTTTIDSSHMSDHDMFVKKIDSTLLQQSDEAIEEIIDIANELIQKLENCADDQKVDFSRDETMRRKIEILFEANPRAFGYEKNFTWKTKEERAEFIAALKKEFKLDSSLLSKKNSKQPIPLEQLFSGKSAALEPESALPMSETIHGLEPSFEQEFDAYLDKTLPQLEPELEQELDTFLDQAMSTAHSDQPDNPPEETKKWTFKNINLGLAVINMQVQAHEITEGRIKKLIKQLAHLNEITKDLSDFINTLTTCKESGKADFSNDPEMQAIIDRIYQVNPKIFGNQKIYAWDSEKKIDILLSSLDAEVKTKSAEINQVTMYINVRYDERVQYSEISKKELDMWIRHCESIISKYHKS